MKSTCRSASDRGETVCLFGNAGYLAVLFLAVAIALNATLFTLQKHEQNSNESRSVYQNNDILRIEKGMNTTSLAPVAFETVSFPYLDERWFREGYCAPTSKDMVATHVESGTTMSLCLIFCLLVYFSFLKNDASKITMTTGAKKNMEQVNSYVFYYALGNVGHAFVHFLIANAIHRGFFPPGDMSGMDDLLDPKNTPNYLVAMFKILPGLLFFWIPILKSYMTHVPWKHIIILSIPSYYGTLVVPMKLGFTYAQTVLFCGSALDNLFFVPTDQKEQVAYMLWPFVVVIPSMATSLLESTMCTSNSVMMRLGHSVFDATLVLSCGLFYLICWWRFVHCDDEHIDGSNESEKKMKKVKVY